MSRHLSVITALCLLSGAVLSTVAHAQSAREQIVTNAAAMLERASECTWDQVGEDGRSVGADCLKEIADGAFGGEAPASFVTLLQKKGPNNGAAWCGLFAVAMIKSGNPSVGDWKIGKGVSSISGMHSTTRAKLQAGDVCYLDNGFQHHALVVEVPAETGEFTTIEGNADCNGSVSTICEKRHTSCTLYYSAF